MLGKKRVRNPPKTSTFYKTVTGPKAIIVHCAILGRMPGFDPVTAASTTRRASRLTVNLSTAYAPKVKSSVYVYMYSIVLKTVLVSLSL